MLLWSCAVITDDDRVGMISMQCTHDIIASQSKVCGRLHDHVFAHARQARPGESAGISRSWRTRRWRWALAST